MKYFKDGLTREELKKEFRNLSKKYHPDVSNDPEAEEIFKAINKEYEEYSSFASTNSEMADFISFIQREIYEGFFNGYNNLWNAGKYSNWTPLNAYFIAFLIKDDKQGYRYRCNSSTNISRPLEFFINLDTPTDKLQGFQCVYNDPQTIMPTAVIVDELKYTIPSDKAMTEYFMDELKPNDMQWYTKETWVEWIKRKYSLNIYHAFDGENGECYGTKTDGKSGFEYYATAINTNTNKEQFVDVCYMDSDYAKLFKVKETINWFDFPFRYYYGYTLDEFIQNHTVESFPSQATKYVDSDIILKLFKKYGIELTDDDEYLIKAMYIPYHKDVIFCSFNMLELVNEGDRIKEDGVDIEEFQKIIDKINIDSAERLKGLIKKGKVSSGI